ncbi:hypothetical protein BBJ28_00017188 [Nothophytophthora sp. Chile5]|nr:hypothetical protein BBJ28_00017188 [Nothophytophthora sp. Chile5]
MRPMFEVENGFDTALRAECRSLDADLGRLSKLSNNSKHAITLNQVQRVQLCTAYDRKDEGGATVYVMNVYLQYVQRGLPTTPGETRSERKVRLRLERDEGEPEYQVEHRYSAFRTLRKRISEVVVDRKHLRWCAYCSRVTWIVSISSFPSRLPNRGFLATCTGWRRLLVHSRKRKLERFVNDLLSAAKDLSYRNGGGQCRRFLTVSEILNAFLMDPDVRPSGCNSIEWVLVLEEYSRRTPSVRVLFVCLVTPLLMMALAMAQEITAGLRVVVHFNTKKLVQ